jgi:hypothetical protein
MARKSNSKSARWADAVADARKAFDEMEEAREAFLDKLSQVRDIQEEYQDWYDNMPESLQDGPTGEKLRELTEFDFDLGSDAEFADMIEAIDNAENADLPLGFGRD